MRAAIYTRISHDPESTRLGVQRQEQDCRELALRRGWEVVDVYEDDDISAFNGRNRPAYRRLVDDIASGTIQAVVAWHPDRLHRHPRELEEFIDVIDRARCTVETVKTGPIDLSTPSGRAVARTLGAWARYESEHKSDRLRAKHLQLAETGRDAGGGRPFGYEPDRRTVREPEAVLIREAARRALSGEPLRAICMDWNKRGIVSTNGRRWSTTVLKRMLCSARIGGRRERVRVNGQKRNGLGEVTAAAEWAAIISVEESDRLRSILTAPERRREGRPRKHLLSGLLRCGLCGKPLHTSSARRHQRRGYACVAGPGFSDGCGRLRVNAEPLEAFVVEAIMEAVDGGALQRAILAQAEDPSLADELNAINEKLAEIGRDGADLPIATLKELTAVWERRRREVVLRLEAQNRRLSVDAFPDQPLRKSWASMRLDQRRAIIQLLLAPIVVRPAAARGPVFDRGRVAFEWRA